MSVAASDRVIIDASIAGAWAFEDEQSDYADDVERAITDGLTALVPPLWFWEIGNILIQAEKCGRITEAGTSAFVRDLQDLPIKVGASRTATTLSSIQATARQFNLTVYDAEYLWLAMEEACPLASLDTALIQAAAGAGVTLFTPAIG